MRSILLCLPLAIAACVSNPPVADAPDAYRVESFQPPPRGATLTLLPPQETQYEELRAGAEQLHKQLHKQLTAAGYRVVALKKDDYVRRWQQEAEAVGGVYQTDSGEFKNKEYVQALSTLLQKSCVETSCALLIDSRLVMRPAELNGNMAEWDGRKLHSNRPVQMGEEAPDYTYAISVEISAIQPDSSLAFTTYGGITLPQHYNLNEVQSGLKKQLSWSDGDIDQGLRIALRPLHEKQQSQAPAPIK